MTTTFLRIIKQLLSGGRYKLPALLLLAVSLPLTFVVSHAQTDRQINVVGVSSHQTATNTVITIEADAPLTRAQRWLDHQGFHVVIPGAVASDEIRAQRGIKLRKIGSSVEILVQVKVGEAVSIQSSDNRLSLIVEGKQPKNSDTDQSVPNEQYRQSLQTPIYYPPNTSQPAYDSGTYGSSGSSQGYPAGITANSGNPRSPGGSPQGTPGAGDYPTHEEGNTPDRQPEELASIFSGTSALVVLALLIFGALVFRRVYSRRALTNQPEVITEPQAENESDGDGLIREAKDGQSEHSTTMVRAARPLPANGQGRERKSALRVPVSTPASLYGAYRIEQEVGKLVMGQAHRMDVLSSRATDDRRAIESSLIKIIASPESNEDERRRAREALEEYGFVARQSASVLLAADAFDRTSAARTLGEIGSSAALPFLLEALYDVESIVRNQAVVSIGELKVPSAIGALLDMARKHPDVPSSLISKALSACSVEGLDFFDAELSTTSFVSGGFDVGGGMDITHLEPASSVEDLPLNSDDEALAQALQDILSMDLDCRMNAVKALAHFPVQTAVRALTTVAQRDAEAGVRSFAIASLAAINHVSVFPTLLIAMADEAREVRAAAARSLSRLSFDRSDAYVRVIETANEQMLREVAQACIKAGIVSQNIDRLASSDRRQAYEAFSLICLLAKANATELVLEAIINHSNHNVRLSAIHLLATTGQPEVLEQLQQLSRRNGLSDDVKSALLEAICRLEQTMPKPQKGPEHVVTLQSSTESSFAEPDNYAHRTTNAEVNELER